MRSLLVVAAMGLVSITGCTIVSQQRTAPTPQSQLQVREFQTREFDTNDVRLVMKACLNVLQDDGFVVKNAVIDLGLLTAEKEVQISGQSRQAASNDDYWLDVFESVFRSSPNRSRTNRSKDEVRYAKFRKIEVSLNVSELGRRSKVRANFQAKTFDNNGQPLDVEAVNDPVFYQTFFAKVDKGIFIQKQGF
ncbi:MAG: hypothetical protein SGJ05_08140 [bacterium]|nr:hypothetical protein [bacterium]